MAAVAATIEKTSFLRTGNTIISKVLFHVNDDDDKADERLTNLITSEEKSLAGDFYILAMIVRRHGAKISTIYVAAYTTVAITVVILATYKGIPMIKALAPPHPLK